MNNTILSYEEYQRIKPTTVNDKVRVETFISEVENYELVQMLGDVNIYNQLLEDSQSEHKPTYFQNIYNNGLSQCIAYLVYAKWMKESGVIDTFSGPKSKNSDYSSNAAFGQVKNISNEYKEMANYYFGRVSCAIKEAYGKPDKCSNTVNENKYFVIRKV